MLSAGPCLNFGNYIDPFFHRGPCTGHAGIPMFSKSLDIEELNPFCKCKTTLYDAGALHLSRIFRLSGIFQFPCHPQCFPSRLGTGHIQSGGNRKSMSVWVLDHPDIDWATNLWKCQTVSGMGGPPSFLCLKLNKGPKSWFVNVLEPQWQVKTKSQINFFYTSVSAGLGGPPYLHWLLILLPILKNWAFNRKILLVDRTHLTHAMYSPFQKEFSSQL